MKTRLGFGTGFFVGYYLGTKAGRERYVQLNRLIRKARRSGPATAAGDKAKAAAGEGFDKAKEKVSHKLHHKNGTGSPDNYDFTPT